MHDNIRNFIGAGSTDSIRISVDEHIVGIVVSEKGSDWEKQIHCYLSHEDARDMSNWLIQQINKCTPPTSV